MKIYNSLTREIEEFIPVQEGKVRMYTCGPTVYDFQHIGNLRTATLMDTVKRTLKYLGYEVTSVMNVTDIEDKIEKRAKETNRRVEEIIEKYEKAYFDHLGKLNISADIYPHATEYVAEQIEIIKELEEKGYTYKTTNGLYFDVTKDADYGKLGNTYKSDKAMSRIDASEGKRNPEDFVLWRTYQEGERQKIWESPWGKGAPGWHIECSAMSMKVLTKAFDGIEFKPEEFETLDLHLAGVDLIETHHENELAQSESATNKQFVKYWLHGGMLVVPAVSQTEEIVKMSKSLSNFVTLETVIEKGFAPLVLRYFYLTGHYRKQLNFTWEALEAAAQAHNRLKSLVAEYRTETERTILSDEKLIKVNQYRQKFQEALENDFRFPEALAVVWEVVKSNIPGTDKYDLLLEFDEVLGLNLRNAQPNNLSQWTLWQFKEIDPEVAQLVEQRERLRSENKYEEADVVRQEVEGRGYQVKDTSEGSMIQKK